VIGELGDERERGKHDNFAGQDSRSEKKLYGRATRHQHRSRRSHAERKEKKRKGRDDIRRVGVQGRELKTASSSKKTKSYERKNPALDFVIPIRRQPIDNREKEPGPRKLEEPSRAHNTEGGRKRRW